MFKTGFIKLCQKYRIIYIIYLSFEILIEYRQPRQLEHVLPESLVQIIDIGGAPQHHVNHLEPPLAANGIYAAIEIYQVAGKVVARCALIYEAEVHADNLASESALVAGGCCCRAHLVKLAQLVCSATRQLLAEQPLLPATLAVGQFVVAAGGHDVYMSLATVRTRLTRVAGGGQTLSRRPSAAAAALLPPSTKAHTRCSHRLHAQHQEG